MQLFEVFFDRSKRNLPSYEALATAATGLMMMNENQRGYGL